MEKIKIGIIGMGQRARFHGGHVFTECARDIQIAAVCDNRPDRLGQGKKEYEKTFGYEIGAYADYRKMLKEAHLDGVYVTSPNNLHAQMTIDAFGAGVHVLCEKPMEINLKRCDDMINAAKKSGLVLAMAMQMNYRPRYHKVKELIKSGAIGKPAMVWCTEYRGPFGEMKDWVWSKAKSGGALVEKNCHHYGIFDLWLSSDPTTVYASGGIAMPITTGGRKTQIVDNAWVINEFKNGVRGMVGICFLGAKEHHREFGVDGTEGKVFFSNADGEILHIWTNKGKKYQINLTEKEDLRGGPFKDFADCIRTGRKPLVTGELGRRSMVIPLAAEMLIQKKRVVKASEVK